MTGLVTLDVITTALLANIGMRTGRRGMIATVASVSLAPRLYSPVGDNPSFHLCRVVCSPLIHCKRGKRVGPTLTRS